MLSLAPPRDIAKLADRLESAIEKQLGFRPKVILRSADDLRKIVGRNPFANRPVLNPAKLAVFFLADAPAAEVRGKAWPSTSAPKNSSPKVGNSSSISPTAWAARSYHRSSIAR